MRKSNKVRANQHGAQPEGLIAKCARFDQLRTRTRRKNTGNRGRVPPTGEAISKSKLHNSCSRPGAAETKGEGRTYSPRRKSFKQNSVYDSASTKKKIPKKSNRAASATRRETFPFIALRPQVQEPPQHAATRLQKAPNSVKAPTASPGGLSLICRDT